MSQRNSGRGENLLAIRRGGFASIRTMIVALALVAACLGGASGQSNTEYHFRQQHVADGATYNLEDNAPILSMDCLAANGYGQWTLSSTSGMTNNLTPLGINNPVYPAGWYLLANGLYKPSTRYDGTTSHPGCIPPGVVQDGPIPGTIPTEAEVTANLDGAVDYVWPDATGQNFIVNEFSSSDLDLSLSFCSNPAPPMNVVRGPGIHPYIPNIPTSSACGCPIPPCMHDVWRVTPAYQDEFQITSDARYLYIVWCTHTNMCLTSTSEIWATVVDRTTQLPVGGWPQHLGPGVKPTVACDPRNNRTTTLPAFEAAWINNTPAPNIFRITCTAGGLGTMFPLPLTYINPLTGLTVGYDHALHARVLVSSAPSVLPTVALYAIVDLDGTGNTSLVFYRPATSGASPAAYVDGTLMTIHPTLVTGGPLTVVDKFITAFANPYDFTERHDVGSLTDQFHCLYQLNATSSMSKNPLIIVEGRDNGAANPVTSTDTRLVLNQSGGSVLADPYSYVAAVNQMGIHVHWRDAAAPGGTHYYARDTSRAFDEDVEENTLVTDICTVSDGSGHGGTAGATILQNRTMAIWTDPNYGFSITAPYVPNSGLWQPRTYGDHNTPTPTLALIDNYVGMLDFRGENVKLNVGGATELVADGSVSGHLTDIPYFYFNFLGANRGSTQGVIVNGTWDYYGLIAVHDPTTLASTVIGSPFTNGSLVSDLNAGAWTIYPMETGGGAIKIGTHWQTVGGDGGVDMPGTLNVHGGANFYCGEWTPFTIAPDGTGVSGRIDVLNENSVFPINSTIKMTGSLTLDGKTTLQRSTVAGSIDWSSGGCMRGHIDNNAQDIILYAGQVWDATDHTDDATHLQFDAEKFSFFNANPTGTSELRLGNFDPTATNVDDGDGGDMTFSGGLADAIEIHLIDPNATGRNYTVQNMSFNDLRAYVILAESDQAPDYPNGYGNVTISGNVFGTFATNAGSPPIPGEWGEDSPVFGIYIRDLNGLGYAATNPYGSVTIYANKFQSTSNTYSTVHDEDGWSSAIGLENSTAFVLDNIISDNGYFNGIYVIPSILHTSPTTYSLICGNTISNIQTLYSPSFEYGAGIYTWSSAGYVKLNTITNCDNGYFSLKDDNPKLFGNDITGNKYSALRLHGTNDEVDLSGVHGGSSNYAAYNTLSGPSGPTSDPTNNEAAILIAIVDNSSKVDVGNKGMGWSNYGENNFMVTSSGSIVPNIAGPPTTTKVALGNIDHNFWGTGVNPGSGTITCSPNCDWSGGGGTITNAASISYSATGAYRSSQIGKPSWWWQVECGAGLPQVVASTSSKPLSIEESDSCLQLWNSANQFRDDRLWQQSYDTFRRFIESCPNDFPNSSIAFNRIIGDVYALGGAVNSPIQASCLSWLKSVLYRNTTDPEYFCSCVEAISGVLPNPDDTLPGFRSRNINIGLAMYAWLIRNTSCDSPFLWQEYKQTRLTQYEQWHNDTNAYKLDTTLPPLSTWGLDTLLAKHFQYAWVPSGGDFGKHVASYSVSENPLQEATTLRFELTDAEYVRVEVFDVLGYNTPCPSLQKTGEGLFEPGPHQIPIDFSRCTSGTYYLRITLGTGEVRTIKLVKE